MVVTIPQIQFYLSTRVDEFAEKAGIDPDRLQAFVEGDDLTMVEFQRLLDARGLYITDTIHTYPARHPG